MAIFTGSAALLTAGKLILKQIAKEGLKKAAKTAVKKGAKDIAKKVVKKKAKDFLSRKRKKGRNGVEGVKQQEGGGSLVLRDKSPSAAVKFVGGKSAKGSAGAATLGSDGGKTSFGEINEKIDNIVGLTASIDAIVKSQYQQKKEEAADLRKEREDRRKRMRESLLEEKKAGDKGSSGTIGGKGGKFDLMKFLMMALIGTVVLGLINAIKSIKEIMDTLGLNLHQLWVIIRYVPQALGKAFGKALKFIKNKGSKFLKGIKTKFGKVFGGVKNRIGKGLKAIATGIKRLGMGFLRLIRNGARALATGLSKGPAVAARILKEIGKGSKIAYKAAKHQVGRVLKSNIVRKGTVATKRFIGRHGRKFVKGTLSNIRKIKQIAKSGFTAIKTLSIKGFQSLKGLAAKGFTKLQGIATVLRQSIKNAVQGLSTVGKGSRVFKHGAARGLNRVILKWFGPKAAKMVAPLGKTFKVLAQGAKGIKIPVVGPIIVLITSLLSGEGTDKALFKGFGTLFGGILGSPLGPLGMLAGELLGEVFGEVLYEGFMGKDGWAGAGRILKQKWDGIVNTASKIGDWFASGFKNFWGWFMHEHSFSLPGWITGGIKNLTFGKVDLENGRIPNVAQLGNPFVTGPLLVKGFFSGEAPPALPENDAKDDAKDDDQSKRAAWDFLGWAGTGKKDKDKSTPTTPKVADTTTLKYFKGSGGFYSIETRAFLGKTEKEAKEKTSGGTTTSSTTTSGGSSFAKDMIKVHEGLRLKVYRDSAKERNLTVGYGHLLDSGSPADVRGLKEGDSISQARADQLFEEDFKHHKDAAKKIPGFGKANENQQAALIDLTFNMGPAWYHKFPKFTNAFKKGDYEAAANELVNSQWYGEVGRRSPTIVSLIKGQGVPQQSAYLKGISPGTSIAQVADRGDASDTDDIPAANLEEGSETPDQTQGALIAAGNQTPDQTQGITQSASYEGGGQEELVVPFSMGGGSSAPIIISKGGKINLRSSSRAAIDTMQKERLLAALY